MSTADTIVNAHTAEQALIGAAMVERGLLQRIQLEQGHFSSPIASEMWRRLQAGEDYITILDATRGQSFGGESVAAWLAKAATLGGGIGWWNVDNWASSIRSDCTRRSALHLMARTVKDLKSGEEGVQESLGRFKTELDAIMAGALDTSAGWLGTSVESEMQKLSDGSPSGGYLTGYNIFDRGGGVFPEELIVVAGRPGHGKTGAMAQIAHNMAKQGVFCLFVTVEMPRWQMAWRFLSLDSGVPVNVIRARTMNFDQSRQLQAAAMRLRELPIKIIDKVREVSVLASECYGLVKSSGCDRVAVFWDYIQRIRAQREPGDNRAAEVGRVSWTAKKLAEEIGAPVFIGSQLNREVEKHEGRDPHLSDLRESGDIEQDAAQVVFVHRPDMINEPTRARHVLAKCRNGEPNALNVQFVRERVAFADIDNPGPPSYYEKESQEVAL